MFRQMVTRMEILALAGVGLLLVAGPAEAQQGWPINGSRYDTSGGSSYGSYRRSRSVYYAPAATASAPVTRGQTYYSAYYQPVNDTVTLNLTVPADAKVWIEGTSTAPGGRRRQFVSPPIQPGKDYTYDIQVNWMQNGREVTSKRHINVHAGDVVNLTFPVE